MQAGEGGKKRNTVLNCSQALSFLHSSTCCHDYPWTPYVYPRYSKHIWNHSELINLNKADLHPPQDCAVWRKKGLTGRMWSHVFITLIRLLMGSLVKNLPAKVGATGDAGPCPGLGRCPWHRTWKPTQVFLPGKSHGEKSLAGSSMESKRVGHD